MRRKESDLNGEELPFYNSLDKPDKDLYLKGKPIMYDRRMKNVLNIIPDKLFQGFFNPKKILKEGSTVTQIISKRADGKTYTFLLLIWYAFQFFGYQSVWVRRLAESLKPSMIGEMFQNVLTNPFVANPKGYDGVSYRSGAFRGYWLDEKEKKKYDIPFCYTMSLNASETSKGTKDIRKCFMLVFDEFTSRDRYLQNEFLWWNNLMSSIGRHNPYTMFIMLGNPVSWESPYFVEYNVGDVKRMERGVHVFKDNFNDFSLTLALLDQKDGAKATSKINSRFFPSKSNSLRAIVHGDWEMNIYPHIVWDNTFDKTFESFVYFESDTDVIQCEIMWHDGNKVDEKPTDPKYIRSFFYVSFHKCNGYDLKKGCHIYTLTPQSKNDDLQFIRYKDKIFDTIMTLDWFFDDNETGEIVRNFVKVFDDKTYLD